MSRLAVDRQHVSANVFSLQASIAAALDLMYSTMNGDAMNKSKPSTIAAAVAVSAALALTGFAWPGPAQAADGSSNTGVADTGPSAYALPESAWPFVEAKLALAAQFEVAFRGHGSAGMNGRTSGKPADGVITPLFKDPIGGTYPTSAVAPGWSFVLFKEGEGNPCTPGTTGCTPLGRKMYTCGPAATRNFVRALTGSAPAELSLENWESTDPSNGTWIGNIVAALNSHYSSYSGWTQISPTSASNLKSYIAADVAGYGQGVIQNVNTQYFSFYNGKLLHHFNVAYAYGESTVGVAEEWDPIFTWGSSAYGNPYGFHSAEPLANDYAAVHNSTTGSISF